MHYKHALLRPHPGMSWVHYPCSELLNTQQTLFLDHLFFWLFVNTAIWFYFNREKWILLIRASLFHCYNSKNEQILHFEKSLEHVFFPRFCVRSFSSAFFLLLFLGLSFVSQPGCSSVPAASYFQTNFSQPGDQTEAETTSSLIRTAQIYTCLQCWGWPKVL